MLAYTLILIVSKTGIGMKFVINGTGAGLLHMCQYTGVGCCLRAKVSNVYVADMQSICYACTLYNHNMRTYQPDKLQLLHLVPHCCQSQASWRRCDFDDRDHA